jgi:phenylacetate-coenzyme A ligase PaaK-like adenylate-forming protein
MRLQVCRIFNQVFDLITGYEINNALAKAIERDFWNRDQIVSDQSLKFQKLSSIASKSEYYSSYRGRDISAFPIMGRQEFKLNQERIKTHYKGSYLLRHSSGSTSSPVTHMISKEMLLAKRVSHQKMLTWYGLCRESPELKIGGLKPEKYTFLYYYLKNKRYFSSFQIDKSSMAAVMKTFNDFKPSILYGYPSSIYNFVTLLEINNQKEHEPRIIVTHAENLYKEMEDKFTRVFPDARIINQYWSTEANIAVTCPFGKLHLDEDTVICEVVNQDENGTGDLLITNLYSYHQPIIRYKIGDRVRLSGVECQCGRQTRVIDKIEGREHDNINLPDKRVIPVTAIHLSRFADNILSYQLIYHEQKRMIEFCYIPCDGNKPIKEHEIINYFKNDFGLSVCFIQTDKIQLTSGGKFKKLIVQQS